MERGLQNLCGQTKISQLCFSEGRMMLPPLPTDNLYKFLTVSFMALAIACFIQGQTSEKLALEEIAKANEYAPSLVSGLEDVTRSYEALTKSAQALTTFAEPWMPSEPPRNTLSSQVAEAMSEVKRTTNNAGTYINHLRDVEAASARKIDTAERLLNDRDFYQRMTYCAMFAFVISALVWMLRFQRHQDRLLKNDLEKSELELEQLRTSRAKAS
jgi:hypothetical protein